MLFTCVFHALGRGGQRFLARLVLWPYVGERGELKVECGRGGSDLRPYPFEEVWQGSDPYPGDNVKAI